MCGMLLGPRFWSLSGRLLTGLPVGYEVMCGGRVPAGAQFGLKGCSVTLLPVGSGWFLVRVQMMVLV